MICPLTLAAGAFALATAIDGDTVRACGQRVRLAAIDAPELRGPDCEAEAQLAREARDRLAEILRQPHRVEIVAARDHYGRPIGVVVTPTGTAGAQLVAEGLARPWNGKRRPWCGAGADAPRP
ncbi:MAG: thermonuclease family protein [Pseudomonadota bacterium]